MMRRALLPSSYRRELRERLSEAQGHRCAYCCRQFGDGDAAPTLEHVTPDARRGPTNYDNCVAACYRCNHARGKMSEWKWYKRVRRERRANKAAPRFEAAA